MKKPTMTAEDEKKHKERKARELQVMLERAEVALEGNRRLFGKKRAGGTNDRKNRNDGWFFRVREGGADA